MIFTSFYPAYSFDSAKDDKAYHRFCLAKTREFSVLWYLYMRAYLGTSEHIMIVDQGSTLEDLTYLRTNLGESFDIYEAGDLLMNPEKSPHKLHIRRFSTPTGLREGVKQLYHYIYQLCYAHHLDMFFIENDCLVARDWLGECRARKIDFATNTIAYQNHRACDTYINYISAERFHAYDAYEPFDRFLDSARNRYGNYTHTNDWEALYDVSSLILNERGCYQRFCYGNVLTFDNNKVIHHGSDTEMLQFLTDNPIDHPFYRTFMEKAHEIVAART